MEFFAECGPDGVPNRGVGDSVVNQDDGIRTGAAFLVVDLAFLDFDEMAGSGLISGGEYARGRCEDDEPEIERIAVGTGIASCDLQSERKL